MPSLYGANVDSSQLAAVFRVGLSIKSDLLTFRQAFKALADNRGKMHEYILAAVIIRKETKTFLRIKPFYCTVIHNRYLQKNKICTHIKQKLTNLQNHKTNYDLQTCENKAIIMNTNLVYQVLFHLSIDFTKSRR